MQRFRLVLKWQAQNEQSVHITLFRQSAFAILNTVRKVKRHSSIDCRRDGSLLWRKWVITVKFQAGQTSADNEQKNTKCNKWQEDITFWWQKFHFKLNLMMMIIIIIIIIINQQNYIRICESSVKLTCACFLSLFLLLVLIFLVYLCIVLFV
jgi:hypothetical protein